jgi:hypothetical protein
MFQKEAKDGSSWSNDKHKAQDFIFQAILRLLFCLQWQGLWHQCCDPVYALHKAIRLKLYLSNSNIIQHRNMHTESQNNVMLMGEMLGLNSDSVETHWGG